MQPMIFAFLCFTESKIIHSRNTLQDEHVDDSFIYLDFPIIYFYLMKLG